MALFPVGKETFADWTDRDLSIAEPGTRILKTNMEPVRKCLERVQDALGYDIRMGYASLKAFLDWVVTQLGTLGNYLLKTGGTMSGDLAFYNGTTTTPVIWLRGSVADDRNYLKMTSNGDVYLRARNKLLLQTQAPGGMTVRPTYVSFDNDIWMGTKKIIHSSGYSIDTAGDFENEVAGRGIILKTPDNTKRYRISIDNSGNVITTLL